MNVSLKGRIYRSFFLLVFLFIVNGLITIVTLYNNRTQSAHISDVIDPSLQAMEEFNKMIIESKMYTTNWVFLRSNEEDKNSLRVIHDSSYRQLKSRLEALTALWRHKNEAILLGDVFSGFEKLLASERIIIGSLKKFEDYDDPAIRLEAERIIEDEVIPLTANLTASLRKLISMKQNSRLQEQNKLERDSLKLHVFIVFLAVTIICIGSLLSFYMTKTIINPINRIRSIVNDLGKGRISKIDYNNTKRDEIGEMILSVNNLSQKLEATATFAREVGLRNFNIPFQPLSEEDTLGKALITMCDNLKTNERELNEANFDRETLFRNIEEVFFSMDMINGKFLQMSSACETVLGYPPSAFMSNFTLWQDIILEDDKQMVFNDFGLMLLGKPVSGEYRALHKDGTLRWVETKITPTLDENRNLIRIDGVTADITERKNTEFKFRESEERYRLLVDNVKDYAIFMLDTNGCIASWNKGAEKINGYSSEDIMGEHIAIFYTRKERDENEPQHNLETAMHEGSFVAEGLRLKKDGTEFWADINFTALYNEKGKLKGFAQMIRDITRTKLNEKKIAEVSERLTLATYAANVGIWDFNVINHKLIWDDGMYRLYGTSADKFTGAYAAWESGIHPDDLAQARLEMEKAISGEKEYDTEFRVVWDDKSMHYIRALGKVHRDTEGKATRIIGTNWDITDRKKSEEELLKSEANLRTIFNHTEAGYILLDNELRIVSFNNLAQEYSTGRYNKELVEGNYLVEYFSADRWLVVESTIANLANGVIVRYETTYNTESGKVKWFDVGIVGVSNTDKRNWGFILTNLDITEKKIAELEKERITADLIQRNKDLEQFTYIVSHNLRAPVANMMGLSSLLEIGNIDMTQKERIVGGISLSVKNLNGIIVDLNNILQNKSQISGEKEIVRFSDLVASIKASISNMIENGNTKIECDFAQVDQVITLKSYLYSIFYNLISNSVKYRQTNIAAIIKITSRQKNEKIELVFEDNGKGIDLKKNNDQVFGLYKRFDTTVEGKGLGLFMVKSQVQTLGGTIALESEINKGTVFKITLPE